MEVIYRTIDGCIFNNLRDAKNHEAELKDFFISIEATVTFNLHIKANDPSEIEEIIKEDNGELLHGANVYMLEYEITEATANDPDNPSGEEIKLNI